MAVASETSAIPCTAPWRVRPKGRASADQGLTPLAINFGRVAADTQVRSE